MKSRILTARTKIRILTIFKLNASRKVAAGVQVVFMNL